MYKSAVIKSLNIAFKLADKETEQEVKIIEITLNQIRNIIINHKILKENITLYDLNLVLKELGFSYTGRHRIIIRDYLNQVIEESNTKL